ncbi:ATP-binding protein [Kamptonema sp. UHCC 0994]|uniref:ATP-binding protein n=1 Tax=Kamptonema sp. UHCC 0994 TaxID=3031329 RepID=UPI0023BAD3A6|nr:ATP-binding protein [Kamptonema sp. UHCC 0994]MDF0556771.1 ATP-binding protein [Kamptonema sp. UHCC 0994]
MNNPNDDRSSSPNQSGEEIRPARSHLGITPDGLLKSESRLSYLDKLPHVVWIANAGGAITYFNPQWQEYTGSSQTEALGFGFIKFIHPEDRDRTIASIQQALTRETSYEIEFRLLRNCGAYGWVAAIATPVTADSGEVLEWIGTYTDIDQFKETQPLQVRMETIPKLPEEAVYFLAQASAILGASLDVKTTLENLAKLIVPYFADWCAINVTNSEGDCRTIAVAHAEMSQESLVWELQQRYPVGADGVYSYLQGLRTGITDACFEISDAQLATIADDADHLMLLRSLCFRSYLCLPIRLGNRTFGSILFVRAQSGHLYTNGALTLAEDLARRAAIAVEKALLYGEAQKRGEDLRQALSILDEHQQQLRTLQRLTNLLNQRVRDLHSLLQVMVDAVVSAIAGAQFCLIVLSDPDRHQLNLTAAAGRGTENLPLGKPLDTIGNRLLLRVFVTGHSELMRSDSTVESLQEGVPAVIYAVAIESASAGRLGAIAIGNWENTNAFNPEAQHLLTAVGKQAAIAINNAQLIEALEKREELLESQNQTLLRQNQELESQRQQIELQNLQLLEAARLKSQFLTTISHELRTPMNAIIGFSELLLRQRQNPITPRQTDMIQRILNNGKNLLALINNILDLSKIEAGRTGLEVEEFDLANLVLCTALEFGALANEKNLAMSVYIYLDNSYIVNDKSRLRQVLINLLSNAVKFTEIGSIYIHVSELSVDRLAIDIRDTGIGISETEITHIFEKFRQVDQTTKRKYPGTGLGLAMTASLIDLMKGTINVESKVGKGSLFRLELPRQVTS